MYAHKTDWGEVVDLTARRGEDRFERCRHFCRLACNAEKGGREQEAIDLFLESFEYDTTYLPTLRGLARVLMRSQKWINARRFLRIITVQHGEALTDDELAETHHQLGETFRHLEQLDKASESYQRALDLKPDHAPTLRAWAEVAVLRGDRAEKLGDPKQAIEAYAKARRMRPEDPRILRSLADLYEQTGQTKRKIEALAALARVTTDVAQRRELYAEQARAWVDLDDMIGAIDCLDRALDEDPSFVEAFEEIEKYLFDARDWSRLAAAYRRMIRRVPKDQSKARAILWRSLGVVYEKGLHNAKAAAVAYATVLRADPSAVDIALRLAEIHAQKRETAPKAIEIYRRLLATSTDPVVPARKLFELYSGLDQLDRAYCALGTLILLGAATAPELEAYALLQKRLPKAPAGALDDELWNEHMLHPQCRSSLAELAAILYRGAPTLFMEGQRQLALKRKERIDPASARARLRFFDVCATVRNVLSVDEVEHYHRAESSEAPRLIPGAPPVMFAGETHDSFGAMKTCQLRWSIARQLATARPELAPAFAVPPEELAAAMEAALSLVAPEGSGVDHGVDPKQIRAWKKELVRNLSSTAMEALKRVATACLERQDMRELAGYLEGAEQTAYRAAFLLAQDCAVVQGNDPTHVRELALFALSEDHFVLREKLSMTVA
jgi:tetratricopeptide (TPR) repeat protein